MLVNQCPGVFLSPIITVFIRLCVIFRDTNLMCSLRDV